MYFKSLHVCIDVNYVIKNLIFFFISLILLFATSASSSAAEHYKPASASEIPWHYAEQGIMGTVVSVKLQHPDKKIAQKISQEIFTLMWDINNEMSNFKPDSLLTKINQQAHKHPLKITDRLFGIIKKSLYYSKISNGAFDITVGTISKYYDYRNKRRPQENIISKRLKYISYKNIKLDDEQKTIYLNNEFASLDLGGIAKGYAISQALKILKQNDIKNAYITAGGDSYALGSKNGRPWYIAIKNPRDGKNNIILPVSDVAISTSGDYERFFIEDNIRYHHIINPTTGHSASKSVSVTVIGDSPEDTDALSTTLFVLGEKKGLELINTINGYDAIYVYPNGKMSFSNGLKRE